MRFFALWTGLQALEKRLDAIYITLRLRGDTEKLFGQKSRQSKTPLETSRFSRKKNRMARGVSPPSPPYLLLARETASTYKLAIARDDSVHHVLPIPLSVE